MKKLAEILESDIDSLISKLLGETLPSISRPTKVDSSQVFSETYQLPVKHTKGGADIDKNNKPWVVGHFIPGAYVNPTHPQGHDGVDLKSDRGTPVYPIASGIVIETRNTPKGGITCKVSHEDGNVISYYAHLDSVSVSVGQKVTQNTELGKMGDTGNAKGRGAHLHYEVKVNNNKIDPMSIVGKKVGTLAKKAEFESLIVKALEENSPSKKFKNVLNKFKKNAQELHSEEVAAEKLSRKNQLKQMSQIASRQC